MRHGTVGRQNQRGVTLIELMVVVVVITISMLIGMQGIEFYQRYQLQAASRQLFSAIEKIRQDALTKRTTVNPVSGTAVTSRGFGLRLVAGGNGYTTFEFNDVDNDFVYDGAVEEYAPNRSTADDGPRFSKSITLTSNVSGPLFYDERGLSRGETWGFGNRTYTLSHSNAGIQPLRCVVVSNIRAREGVWNAGDCI